jgi:phosphohistidine phosphatase
MKRLFLLRHAKSSWDDQRLDDADRPLAERGQAAAERMGLHMAKTGWIPDLVLCSSARRARETFERLQQGLAAAPSAKFEDDLYEADPADLFRLVQATDDAKGSLLLIGHNPEMAVFAHRLVGDGEAGARERMAAKFPTAALAVIRSDLSSWGDIGPGGGFLEDFVRPRDLKD